MTTGVEQNRRYVADDFLNAFFLNENNRILLAISLKFISKLPMKIS